MADSKSVGADERSERSEADPIFVIDDLRLRSGQLAPFLEAFETRYRPGAEARGQRLLQVLVHPPTRALDVPHSVVLLWQVDGIAGFWGVRSRNATEDVVRFWRDCDATLRGTEKQAYGCFASSQNLTNVRSPRETNWAHNTALLWDAGAVYALGGRDNPTHHRSYAGVRIGKSPRITPSTQASAMGPTRALTRPSPGSTRLREPQRLRHGACRRPRT